MKGRNALVRNSPLSNTVFKKKSKVIITHWPLLHIWQALQAFKLNLYPFTKTNKEVQLNYESCNKFNGNNVPCRYTITLFPPD